jgi:hypothetical protein
MRQGAAFCVLALLAAGCGSEAVETTSSPISAPASSTSSGALTGDANAFVRALRNKGLPIDSDEYATALGYSTCDMLGGDFPDGAAEELVRNGEPDFSEDQVTFFVAAAQQHYCRERR